MRRPSTSLLLLLALGACRGPVTERVIPQPPSLAPSPRPPASPTPAPTPVAAPRNAAERRSALARAVALVERDRCAEAAPILDALRGTYLEVEDYLLHYRARCAAALGDDALADQLWNALLAEYPESLHVAQAALEIARRLRARGAVEAARVRLRTAQTSEDKWLRRAVDLEQAQIEIATGSWRAADATLTDLRSEAAGTAIGRTAKSLDERLRAEHPDLRPRGAGGVAEARLLLREGDFETARRIVADLLASAAPEQRPALLALRANVESAAGERERSLATLAELYQNYPASAEAPEALYRSATRLWNSDQDEAAGRLFAELLNRYPTHPQITTARYALGRIEQSAGRDDAAITAYHDLIRGAPRSQLAREARWRIGWIQYRRGRWGDAITAFERLVRGRGVDEAADALYWRGRSLERSGRRDQARQDYQRIVDHAPDSYYAALAEQRLGRGSAAAHLRAPEAFADHIGAAPAGAGDTFHLVRARELQRAGLRPLARRELAAWERTSPRTPEIRRFLLASYPAVDGYRDAIRLVGGGDPRRDQILYPAAFWPLVREHTARNRLDLFFVLSLMRQESLFDPAARSPADARGLMQLLPSTAAAVARRGGRPDADLDLYDPELNITLGTAHLAELAERYQGDWIRMLGAYNAGAAAVDKWQAHFGDLPPDEFVESITYRETRDYVKRTLANVRRYGRLYGS